ncbi:MAG: M6 family metalloprotease domain-containing protein [Phycisphaerales bacterium]|nr:M6 family metalloprotease domain-containing protein [Phycisphaerales bacterium]
MPRLGRALSNSESSMAGQRMRRHCLISVSSMLVLVTGLTLLSQNKTLHAMPASPHPVDVLQPDGKAVTLQIRGDEYFHWFEDQEGYTVIRNERNYVYATLNERGELAATEFEVGKVDPATIALAKGVLPTSEIRQSLRQKALPMFPIGAPRAAASPSNVPPSGTVKNLVVLCMFNDHTLGVHTRPDSNYDVLWNAVGGDPILAPTGSVRDVFTENSYGVMTLESTVTAWVTLPQTEAYYANGISGLGGSYPENPQGMVAHALDLVDPMIDFGQFDQDNDGFIDAVSIVHSGYGAETGGGGGDWIWSHKWSLWQLPGGLWTSADTNGMGENVKVFDYHTEPALWGTSGTEISRIGVAAHETGHFFGLPDLYDTDGGGQGIGSYGMMANSWGFNNDQLNPPHFSAWSKIFLGWVTPTILTSPGSYNAPQVQTNPTVFRVDAGYPADEYLLIENRQPVGFDGTIPQGGLAVWHIDENKGSFSQNNVNTDEGYPGQAGWPGNNQHYRVALLQADGNYDLERGNNRGDSGDLYHAGAANTIGTATVPDTDAYQGGIVYSSGVTISNISTAGSNMSFTFDQDCNENGISDTCDIDCGTANGPCDLPGCGGSQDCNANSIPDECEPDCNANGQPDECDISNMTSTDCNANGVPDECEGASALDFDGVDDWVHVARSAVFEPADELTIEVWIRPDSVGSQHARIVRNASPQGYILAWQQGHDQRVQLRIDGASGGNLRLKDTVPTTSYLGTWLHVAGVYSASGNYARLYVNGALKASSDAVGTINYSNAPLRFGNWTGCCEDFDGLINEVRIWDVARSEQEIADNKDRRLSGTEPGLAGYWRLNEGQGQNAFDSSPHQNHGFLGNDNLPMGDGFDPVWVSPGAPIEEPDCNQNGNFDFCDIAEMTSNDCNGNGIPDECEVGGENDCDNDGTTDFCEIAAGSPDCDNDGVPNECELSGNDCNVNGLPDNCETDCNGNGIPDECDITNGTSADTNMNGIPDECEFFLVTERVRPCGRFYLTGNGATDSLRVYDRDGNPVAVYLEGQILSAGGTHSFDVDGNLLISQWDADHVKVVHPDGTLVRTIDSGGLNAPHGATMTPSFGIAVCSYLSDSIKFYETDGTFLSNLSSNVSDPQCLAFDREGNLYVGNRNNGNGNIAVFDDQLQFVRNMGVGLFAPHPLDMAFDVNQVLYVTMPGSILKFDTSGGFLGSVSEPGLDPRGIAIDENGVRWVTNRNAYNIYRFDDSDQFIDIIPIDFGPNPPNNLILYGIAFDVGADTDCNNNGQSDSCEIDAGTEPDCNNNGLPDDCDLPGNDCNANGLPDDCDPDCNGDGIPDDCQLAGNDCNSNGVHDDCDPDCNGDGIADDCQLAGNDCNSNGIVDECEPDCNGNQIPDDCDVSAGTADDCNNNGILDNCEIAPGNSALQFDGSDDHVRVLNDPVLEPDEFTLELWAYLDGNQSRNTRLVRRQGHAGQHRGYIFAADQDNDDRIQLRVPGLILKDTQSHDAYAGAWHHFAGVYTATEAFLYVDGQLVNSVTHEIGPMRYTTSDLYFGRGLPSTETTESFKGMLTEIRLWSVPRSQQNILENMNIRLSGNEPGLAGYWPIEDAGGQIVVDLTSNANNGTLGTDVGPGGDLADPQWVAFEDERLLPDCNSNGVIDECDIASMTSGDCDVNGIPDECEFGFGDCNSNGTTDRCEPGGTADCNGNGLPDVCDIFNGSNDCNANTVPDECEFQFEAALNFDGVNDYVSIPHSSEFKPENELTVEAWIFLDSAGQRWSTIVDNYADVAGFIFGPQQDNDLRAQLVIVNSSGILRIKDTDATTDYIGGWHHIAGVYSVGGGFARIYVDGVLKNEQTPIGPLEYSNADLFIGNGTSLNQEAFHGAIDEIRIWNVARSQQDILDSMNDSLAGNEPGLVGYWRFNEGSGQQTADFSPNGNNGTLGSSFVVDGSDPSWIMPGAPINQNDCNNNGVLDECDITSMTSADCNANGTPDECEPGGLEDCNANSEPDLCDLHNGTSQDCNGDAVPDECQLAGNDCNGNNIPDDCEPDCDADGTPDECAISAGADDCNNDGIPDACWLNTGRPLGTYRIRAFIDDHDLLILTGNTAQWHHQPGGAAVGRHPFGSGNEPTFINGVPWIPEWPEDPPASIDYEALSSVFTALEPPLPRADMTVQLTIIEGRDVTAIHQLPAVENDYTLIIELDDPSGGPAWYEFELEIHVDVDCNDNNVLDECDIANMTSDDCNGNGMIDECDVSSGTSSDLNANLIPDECEVDARIIPVATLINPALTTEVRPALPASLTSVAEGTRYYIEVWASDVGDLNTGLSGVYVDIDFCTTNVATAVFHGNTFDFLPLGTIESGGVDEFGAATFNPNAAIEPQWVRVGWIEMVSGAGVSPCTFSLQESSNGVGAVGRGAIPWEFIELGSLGLEIVPTTVSYDLDGDNFIGFGDFVIFLGSWLQTVPPADPAHDFNCNGFVGPGDLSWFATGWQKNVGDPTILYPPCNAPSFAAQRGAESGIADIAVKVLIVPTPSASPTTTNLPTSMTDVPLGSTYYAEIWASDTGDINSGLTSAYLNLAYPSAAVDVLGLTNNLVWTVLQSGHEGEGVIEELGGSDLPGGLGMEPEWILVGIVELKADTSAPAATFELLPSATGIAALARGSIPWSNVGLDTATLVQGIPGDIDSDGDVDPIDMETFVSVLIGMETAPARRTACDFNGDGSADGQDVQQFVEAYIGL